MGHWTQEAIEEMIKTNPVAAMRGVCAVFRQQVADERSTATTRYRNNRGFSQAHARVGTELATWMTNGKMDGVMRRSVGGCFPSFIRKDVRGRKRWVASKSAFAGRNRVEVCRELALHYSGQITNIANIREARKAA